MKSIKTVLISGLFLTTLASMSCDKEKVAENINTNFEFALVSNGATIDLGDQISTDSIPALRIDEMKFYISNIKFYRGTDTMLVSDVELVSFLEGKTSFSYEIRSEGYDGMVFGLGLNPIQNATDPTQVELSDPLSAAWGMYWSWGAKYRFVVFEGKANMNGMLGSSDDISLSYHPGADNLYKRVEINVPINGIKVIIPIDIADLFNGPGGYIKLPEENQTHTTPSDYVIAEKFITNMQGAL